MFKQFQRSGIVSSLCILFVLTGTASAGLNDGVDGLNEEQQALAKRFLQFQDDNDAKFFGRADEINGGNASDVKENVKKPNADYYVRVARGDVVEKIGRMISRPYEVDPDSIMRETTFSRYYGMDVHAKSPLMGHVHTAIILQYYPDGRGTVGGTLNMLKGAAQEEDLQYVKQALDEVFEKHGRDSTPYRKRVCNMSEEAVQPEYHRKLACVGASFFGFPMMEANEENFLFMTDIYQTFISAYLDTVEGRKDDPFTAADVAAQEAMRKNWAEDQFLGDPYSSGGVVPYAVWGAAFLPPVVKF